MANTTELNLPLLAAAQAQKHVTVNEALLRIDALAMPRLSLPPAATPPGTATDGQCFAIGAGATGAWAGKDGDLAIWLNGGWVFVTPKSGWQGWETSQAAPLHHDGSEWVENALSFSSGGAVTISRVIEIDHVIGAGASSMTGQIIPANAQVTGVTARVLVDIMGTATGWSLGVSGSANRYGSGLGLTKNSHALGLTGAPVTYYSGTELVLTAEGGTFASGSVRLAVHVTELRPPRQV